VREAKARFGRTKYITTTELSHIACPRGRPPLALDLGPCAGTLSPCAMPDTAIPGHCLSHVLLTDAADSSVGKSPPDPKPSATAAAWTVRHGHSSTVSLPHHQHSVDSSMDSARHPRSPAGASCTLVPQAKVAAHQPQQSSSSRPPLSSGLLTQMLVTAFVVADQDQQPSPSDARGSRLNESAPTRAAESEFPPGPTTTIGSSCRSVQTAPDGAATPTRLVAHPSLTKPYRPATICITL
jgi:hypothetical protein